MVNFGEYPKINAPFAMKDPDKYLVGYASGLDVNKATPVYNGGTQITRHDLNGLGYLATVGAYLDRIGYSYGSYSSGGTDISYPKGAILTVFNGETVEEWVSLQDNNSARPLYNFTESDYDRSNLAWKPIYEVKNYNFFPDYSSRKLLDKISVNPGNPFQLDIKNDEYGWLLVQRSFEGWEDVTAEERMSERNDCEVIVQWGTSPVWSAAELEISPYEGERASRLIPLPAEATMRVKGTFEKHTPFQGLTIEVFAYPFEETA